MACIISEANIDKCEYVTTVPTIQTTKQSKTIIIAEEMKEINWWIINEYNIYQLWMNI